ncbi:MAG TPA: complex I NDUFA9 subunit family protein [Dongiaceae bacterium]|nr:complex I NDUFA9 subunit family protein [Dongiaceae bacterium]
MAQPLVTVFGGSGFVGRHVVSRLAQEGWQVRVAVRRPDEALFLKPAGAIGQVTPIAANIRDRTSVARAVAGADAVINLVGILYESGRQRFKSVQADGPAQVAEEAARAGASRFVQVSAIGADANSKSAYARTKGAGEAAVLRVFPTATIIRPSIIIGPEDGFFNRFAQMAMLSPALPLIGGGRTRFQPVYVGDVAAAIANALKLPEAQGKTYELAGPRTYTFKELMRILLREIERKRLLLPLPFAIAGLMGAVMQCLPSPQLTLDQVRLLKRDNVAAQGALGLQNLGVQPTALESVVPTYLDKYRKRGNAPRE